MFCVGLFSYHRDRLKRSETAKRAGTGRAGRSSSHTRRNNRQHDGMPDSFELAAGSLATSMISTIENVILVPIRYVMDVAKFILS